MAEWRVIPGGVTAPRGFQGAGIASGLKPSGAPDLALIYSEYDAIGAGVFTNSYVRAACVDYCRQRLEARSNTRAILVNAGQANACTGNQGWVDAVDSAETLATALGLSPEEILLASTGVIGQRLKIDQLKAAIPRLVSNLSNEGSDAVASAIITTDLVTKTVAMETLLHDRPVRIGGVAKGSGMIHPNMATMLAFVTCDATVSPTLWQDMLRRAANRSFNQITVDGDTSTNDSLIALANGQSRTPAITDDGEDAQQLESVLTAVCQHLAKAIARDGEGATCLIDVTVSGAINDAAGNQVARTIAGSSLVKSAVFGHDPNWGRIAAAAGRAGVNFDQNDLRVQLGDMLLMEHGQPLSFDRAAASAYLRTACQGQYLQTDTVAIKVTIGNGTGMGQAWGCDLSYDYVKINAEYTT